jgi:putative DNA primase/helicase
MVNDERYQLPYVSRLLQCPVIDGEGKICSKGYHPQINEGTYITDGESEQVESLQTAIDHLCNLVKGYRFTTPADKTRALAMMITPALIQGGLIDGLIPAGVSEADLIGSGKTLWQTVLAAIYNDSPVVITQQRGGVGSMDESICSGLLTGRAFVQLDNLRYKLDSTVLETLLTSPNHSLSVRVPHRGLLTVSTKGLSIYITSNGVQTTDDQADRSCFVRILKQPGTVTRLKYIQRVASLNM